MDNLLDVRNQINEIDKTVSELFSKRMDLCKEIGRIKVRDGLPVTDASREKEVIVKAVSYGKSEYAEYTEKLFETMIKLSKELQENSK